MLTRRRLLSLSLVPFAAGCRGGFPTVFGYRLGADALYDPCVKTVYVPTFQNRAFQTTPYRGFEVDITQSDVTRYVVTRPISRTSACVMSTSKPR